MKVKKITVEYDNDVIIQFSEEELDALQKARAVLELIDTGTNLSNLFLQATALRWVHPKAVTEKE